MLHRTLSGFSLTPERIVLFLAHYPPDVPTLEDARAIARGPTPERAMLVVTEQDPFMEAPIEILWFRTLTDQDRELLP
jgi:hypothetical protein